MNPGIELKIANTQEAAFLLQAELNAIQRGCVYLDDGHGISKKGIPYT